MTKFNTLQELFADPSRWTQNRPAKNQAGLGTYELDPEAVCWCLSGGINLVYGRNLNHYIEVRDKISNYIRSENGITGWNDSRTRTIEDIQQLVKELDI